MATLTRDQLLQQHASARVYQERYDDALQPLGVRANAPVLGQDILDYRRNELVRIKKLLPDDHELRRVQIRQLPTAALDTFEPQYLRECRATAYRADTVPLGQMRRVEDIDANGLKIVKWIGQTSFVREMGRPCRRVVSFLTPHGRVNGAGQPVR
jgi:hypothetical protein